MKEVKLKNKRDYECVCERDTYNYWLGNRHSNNSWQWILSDVIDNKINIYIDCLKREFHAVIFPLLYLSLSTSLYPALPDRLILPVPHLISSTISILQYTTLYSILFYFTLLYPILPPTLPPLPHFTPLYLTIPLSTPLYFHSKTFQPHFSSIYTLYPPTLLYPTLPQLYSTLRYYTPPTLPHSITLLSTPFVLLCFALGSALYLLQKNRIRLEIRRV